MFMEFEGADGAMLEMRSPIGVVTVVFDKNATPPFRLYGPDGIEVDPHDVYQVECGYHIEGFAAFDMTKFRQE